MDNTDFLYASDKTGEAVRATLTSDRAPASTTIEVDSSDNWPTNFVATVGTLNEATGIIEANTVTVFKGHSSGGDIIIDEFAPGYSDNGNTTGQVVVLKPNTFWADLLSDVLETTRVTLADDGSLKADTVDTQAIEDGAVESDKLTLNTDVVDLSTGGSISYSNSASLGSVGTTPVDVTGMTATITTTSPKVLVSWSVTLAHGTTANGFLRLAVDSDYPVKQAMQIATTGRTFSGTFLVTGLTSASHTFKFQAATDSSATLTVYDRFMSLVEIGN